MTLAPQITLSRKAFRFGALFVVNVPLRGTRFFSTKARLLRLVGFAVHPTARIVGPVRMSPTCTLEIGEGTWVGTNLTVHGNGRVTVEDRCDIGPDVTFLTGTHSIGPARRRAGDGRTTTIVVHEGTWIGARATVLGPRDVGPSSVVGTGSLVNRDVAPNTLSAGVPARGLKRL